MGSVVLALHARGKAPGPSLPKEPRTTLTVTLTGIEGDHNAYRTRRRGGDPRMAVLLLPSETLEALSAAGWPVEPGHLGENMTLAGVPNDSLAEGVRLRVGSVELELTEASEPCRKLSQLPYVGATRLRAFQRALRGRRGFYARVLCPGLVQVGDPVTRSG